MFILLSIAMMWLMIFGVGCFYFGMLPKSLTNHIILITTLSLLTSCVAWLLIGYPLAFGTSSFLIVSTLTMSELLNALFQLCFCLYAIIMVIGSVIDRLSVKQAICISFLWVIFVYTPLVNLFWNENGFITKLGALDFSGGMVVHLSAGLSSYLLAKNLPSQPISHDSVRNEWLYLGMIFITLGWFFFNAGPVGELNEKSILIIVKTLFALIIGGGVWLFMEYKLSHQINTSTLLNGIIVGLVTSTSSVGYVSTLSLIVIVALSSGLTYWAIQKILPLFSINDVVDSFGMNGIGGALGSIGTALFIPTALFGQFIGLLFTIILSFIVTQLLSHIIIKIYSVDRFIPHNT